MVVVVAIIAACVTAYTVWCSMYQLNHLLFLITFNNFCFVDVRIFFGRLICVTISYAFSVMICDVQLTFLSAPNVVPFDES